MLVLVTQKFKIAYLIDYISQRISLLQLVTKFTKYLTDLVFNRLGAIGGLLKSCEVLKEL
jgi:hypothetical protein